MAACIYCGSDKDLNTELRIPLGDGQQVTVYVCDVHAEDATVKTAREKYQERQHQIEAFMAQARALGLNVQINDKGLATASQAAPPAPAATPAPATATQEPPAAPLVEGVVAELGLVGDDVIDTRRIDALNRRQVQSITGSTAMGQLEGHASHDLTKVQQQLPAEALQGRVKIGVIEGRGGQPVAIPVARADGTGLTQIRSTPYDDAKLQRRFKDMAQATIHDRHDGFAQQYDVRTCPLCKGEMTVLHQGQRIACPKCSGTGVI